MNVHGICNSGGYKEHPFQKTDENRYWQKLCLTFDMICLVTVN